MFVPLLVASHNAVTKKIIEVKKFQLTVIFAIAFNTILTYFKSNFFKLCGEQIFYQIEHKQINCLKIEKTWRIALMRVAFKKDDL